MFKYILPEGGINSVSIIKEEGHIRFEPPVHEQRYCTAILILEDQCWSQHFKKVVDFGCSDMKLLTLLRRSNNIEHILEVDMDEACLVKSKSRAEPLASDYLLKRDHPLRVEVLKGSIDAAVENLKNVDAVIALEIIEHLEPDVLEKVPKNIFGFIQPKLVIVSTPNSEFNVLFQPLLPNGFRHEDHKFEWTRSEFKKWALDICKQYPNYAVSFLGVGLPPAIHKKLNLGCVTQIAVFARHDIRGLPLVAPLVDMPIDDDPDKQYKQISASDFPYGRDKRSTEQKILDEVTYIVSRCNYPPKYFNREREVFQIPLAEVMEVVTSLGVTEQELRQLLIENKYNIDENSIILPSDYYLDDSSDDLDELVHGLDGDDYWFDHNGQDINPEDDLDTENTPSESEGVIPNNEEEENWDSD